jgi:hypothetical protein
MDQSPGRPARESVSVTGQAEFSVPSGVYGLMTAAEGYQIDFRDVRVVDGPRNDITVELLPGSMIGGRVLDAEGKPIAGASVCDARAASPVVLADMSELALRYLNPAMRTTTDENGSWQLARSRYPLLIEAKGWSPGWVSISEDKHKELDVVLQRGSSLLVALDRPDPAAIITPVPIFSDEIPVIPAKAQPRVWGREAIAGSVHWTSLQPGNYKLVASYPDPLRFTDPVEVGNVTLVAGGSGTVRVRIPPVRPPATASVSLLVPRRADLTDLHAFTRASEGVRNARHSIVDALGGKVIFIDTAVPPADVYLITGTELMTVGPDSPKKGFAALEPTRTPKGVGKLRIIPDEGIRLPSYATVAFSACIHGEQVVLPVNVSKDGALSLPLVVPCRSLTLSFGDLGTLGLTASVGAGEEKWLGAHRLTASASAEVHVMYAGVTAAGVVVRAMVTQERQKVAVGEAVADDAGTVVMNSLPAGEITFEARIADTQNVGTATVTLDPGKKTLIDPLEIPEPASLILSADFDPLFKSENPDATLFGLVLEREGSERPKDSRNVQFADKNREVTFDDLTPGRWHIIAMIKVEDVVQPVEVESVDLKAGDEEHVSARVKPRVFKGQVLSGGRGIPVSIGIGDLPGPHAVRRDIQTTNDGKFKVVLPQSGFYRVTVRRSRTAAPTEFGPVAFNDTASPVRIELPDTVLTVRVRSKDVPAADVGVTATTRLDNPDGTGVTGITKKAKTDSSGTATIENLQPGMWLLEARETRSGGMGAKSVTIATSRDAETTIELDHPTLFNGVVIDERGGLAAGASVDCVFLGPEGSLRSVHGEADASAAFSIFLPAPAPSRLDCGVATADGAIGAFVTAPGDRVQLGLPQSTGRLTILDWGERVVPDRFWLAAADGRVFNLSWAARKFGRAWSPLTITRLPSGPWNVVRADSAGALTAIARGVARSLPAAATVRLGEGQAADIRIQGDSVPPR